ncbi:HPP family protein [Paraburkholderia sp. BCC1884]|uniref:HPP family protein n=1 Tax=Paraburkholderia sp. BCC1884 TaxID=2562668 RepID=UPI0021B1C4CE|nr:HPP family protein [Paraburkholderia sp. BCC1884]
MSAVLISLCFMGGMAGAASAAGVALLLFPELAALSYDVFMRPRGTWARAPWMLAFSPAATAVLGVLVTRYLPYSAASVAICIMGAIVILKLMRSPIAPAISACVLALSLGEKSWLYPLAILLGTGALAVLSSAYRRFFDKGAHAAPSSADRVNDEIESLPGQFRWVPYYVAFLSAAYLLSMATGMRMVFFPPLVVIAFEMFAHADVCPWAQRPVLLPAVCTLAAAAGVAALTVFGPGVISTLLAMLFGVVMLRATRLYAIPALAIGLLPQVMTRADWHFPLAVAIGSTLLTASFLLFKKASGVGRQVAL